MKFSTTFLYRLGIAGIVTSLVCLLDVQANTHFVPPVSGIQVELSYSPDNLCTDEGEGSIIITSSGSTGEYEYSIDNGGTWSLTSEFRGLLSAYYYIKVRDTNLSCEIDYGAYYIGCSEGSVLQFGDAIYSCIPIGPENVTLAVDRVQRLHDFYEDEIFFEDISDRIQNQAYSWNISDLGGPVYGVAVDPARNIYTANSSLFQIIQSLDNTNVIKIDAVTGQPKILATLPGIWGASQVEYNTTCDALFVANLSDGIIYLYDSDGDLLSTFDPLQPDNGDSEMAPLGERVSALAYSPVEGKLYYSVWSNDKIDNGTRNTVRSVSIRNCDFDNASDLLEIEMPLISELVAKVDNYSHPVLDLEINQKGNILLIGESGFESGTPIKIPHKSRVLRYDGMSSNWELNTNLPEGNTDYFYEIGTVNDGSNSLGGVDFAYAGIDNTGCTQGQDEFIISLGDALRGLNCVVDGCIYGMQYMPVDGGKTENSVLFDISRDPGSQQKGFYGDVDIINGCCPCAANPLVMRLAFGDVCIGQEAELCIESVTGGYAPYTYNWDTMESTDCITVTPTSPADSYTISITDAQNQTIEQTIFASEEDCETPLIYDMAISKRIITTGPYMIGDIVTYGIEVANQGDLPSGTIVFEEMPGTNLVFIEDNVSSIPNITSLSNFEYEVIGIAPKTSVTLEIKFQITRTGNLKNGVLITNDDGDDVDSDPDCAFDKDDYNDGEPDDDEATVEILVVSLPCQEASILFDFDACIAGIEDLSNCDYSEFTPIITNNDKVTFSVIGNNLYRQRPEVLKHSCTPGRNGTSAMCVSFDPFCNYLPGSPAAVRFDISAIPSGSGISTLNELSFYEKAPIQYEWIDGASGINNYPLFYAIRVLRDGAVVYEEKDIPTSRDWTLSTIDFSDNPAFNFQDATVFNFELIAYCPIGVVSFISVWDLEDLKIVSGSTTDCPSFDAGTLSFADGSDTWNTCTNGYSIGVNRSLLCTGPAYSYVLTDMNNTIVFDLGDGNSVNLNGQPEGEYRIWGWSRAEGRVLELGLDISSLTDDGCEVLSLNSLIVDVNGSINPVTISGGPFEFCAGDGVEDYVFVDQVTVTGTAGSASVWVVTDINGNIVNVPDWLNDYDFGINNSVGCFFQLISTNGPLGGLQEGQPIANVTGCFHISNALPVTKSTVEGGGIGGGPVNICIGEGSVSNISAGRITTSPLSGFGLWIVTDNDGVLVEVADDYSTIDFDMYNAGTLQIRYVNYEMTLGGLAVGQPISGIAGCYDFSNTIDLIFQSCTPITGGTLVGGPFSFCTSDDLDDYIDMVSLTNTESNNNRWIITDENGVIISLPNSVSAYNFEGTESGVNRLYNIGYNTTISGLELGNNIYTDLSGGDYALSASILIEKSQLIGGRLEGGPFEFCTNNGSPDHIGGSALTFTSDTPSNTKYIVTDRNLIIVEIGDAFTDFDFDTYEEGSFSIWALSYDGSVSELMTGVELDVLIDNLSGCFALSNSISIISIQVEGGVLTAPNDYFGFCVNDGIPDFIPQGSLTLTDNVGESYHWVITNVSGTEILALPNSPYEIDFETAAPGSCVIWNLSIRGQVNGLEVGSDFLALDGCVDRSNFVSVLRYNNTGGSLSGSTYNFCVGDGQPDFIPENSITLSGNTGANSQWIIVDENGLMKDIPLNGYSSVDFDSYTVGTSYLYHMSYDGLLTGLAGNRPLAALDGCFTLSNALPLTMESCPLVIEGLVITQVSAENQVELKNTTGGNLDISTYVISNYPHTSDIKMLDYVCYDSLVLASQATIIIQTDFDISPDGGEIALFSELPFTEDRKMMHYVIWGDYDSGNENLAVELGLWGEDRVEAFGKDKCLAYDGDGYGASDWSVTTPINCMISANENFTTKVDVKVFPNPVTQILQIDTRALDFGPRHVEIVDKLGRVLAVRDFTDTQIGIDMSEFHSGVYFLTLYQEGKRFVKAVVKM